MEANQKDVDVILFKKFPKIYENMGNFKAPKKMEWIATEKIDGSNFSVYTDGIKTKFAKRTGFIDYEDWFFNYQKISFDLSIKVKKLYNLLKDKNSNINYIIVYGELCGGFYPNNIKNWKGPVPTRINNKGVVIIPLEQRAIQEGVYYCDKINLIVFDIAIVNKNESMSYLEYNEMESKCKEVNLYYTPILIKGTIQKLMDYSLEFDSTIPKLFGLECLPNNLAEGIVIRPSFWNNNKEERPMLKRKNKKYRQLSGDFDMNLVKKNPYFASTCMINQNRLNGVISKIGPKNRKEIIDEFVEDVWSSISEIGIQIIDYDEINEYIIKNVTNLVDDYLSNL